MVVSEEEFGFAVALVAAFLRAGLFLSRGVAFCSNIPIREVVGRIDLVSSKRSSLSPALKPAEPGLQPGDNLVKLFCSFNVAAADD
jgi:hypothetical protein